MEYHLLPIFTFLALALVVTHAALSPQLYWKSTLPTTPMPKAISDLLNPDWTENKGTYVGVGKGGVNVNAGKEKPGGTTVNVGKGGVNVNTGKAKPGGTTVNVGKGGVNVHAGHKGKPVRVRVGHSPFSYKYAATETQLHDDPNVALFFLEKDLRAGTKLNLHFTKSTNDATFLTREIAKTLPFSSSKLPEILNQFSVKPESEEAEIIKNTIKECEEPGIKGEEKYCVTSLESMVDFSTSKLGKNVEVIATEAVDKDTQLQKYTIAPGVKKLDGGKAVVCHKQNYPYAIFYCHTTETSTAYFVPLEGNDRTRLKAAAVCHTDTSQWNPKHLAFQVLKVQPGTVPVCHFLPQDHLVWVPQNN